MVALAETIGWFCGALLYKKFKVKHIFMGAYLCRNGFLPLVALIIAVPLIFTRENWVVTT